MAATFPSPHDYKDVTNFRSSSLHPNNLGWIHVFLVISLASMTGKLLGFCRWVPAMDLITCKGGGCFVLPINKSVWCPLLPKPSHRGSLYFNLGNSISQILPLLCLCLRIETEIILVILVVTETLLCRVGSVLHICKAAI
uniref:Uncharacterized protein n=1 Tax=Pyxicephalus adspersus TaxID=30357 RepID=A0AAV3A3H7_PYXAD|nr:TPA: hypothetical protein GDO54_017844 [Pyxicephalus adspersus]